MTRYLRTEHLSKHPLDDEMSERALKLFLKQLDPQKSYFLKSDVDDIMQHRGEIDDRLKEQGDVSLAYKIFNIFLKRVDERMVVIDQLIAKDQDFSVDEEFVVDPDKIDHPKTQAEADQRWARRIKYDFLDRKSTRLNSSHT